MKKTNSTILVSGIKSAMFSFLVCLLSVVFSSVLYSDVPTAEFLRINPSAAASSLGGAYSGYTGSVDSIYVNPAGLVSIDSSQLSTTYIAYLQDIDLAGIAYARPFGKNIFGMSIVYLGVSGIDVIDNAGAHDGTAKASNYAIGISWSREILGLGIGASIKEVHQDYDGSVSDGFACDVGAVYGISDITLGLALQNIGPDIDGQKLPATARLGAVYPLPKIPVKTLLELEKPVYSDFKFKAGAEYEFVEKLCVRAGYEYLKKTGDYSGISAGLGFQTDIKDGFMTDTENNKLRVAIDYAFSYFGELGNSHKISLGMKF
ncbi:MAG: hypothetical protein BWY26_01216 [Elusimicrobia bacterium ADurb.Bin231]|nr:MAG: hypothetical protein BWY26_01216 [Elusimicrobia bacterium ADurb.Bin231]